MKTTLSNLLIAALLLLGYTAMAQGTQTIRGIITDAQSNTPVPGATIIVMGSEPLIGTTTDYDGAYKLENVPVGRVTLQISFLGYENITLTNLELNSAKELVLDVPLVEQVNRMDEVVVSGTPDKDKPLNDMATVSARTLSMTEANKYSGTRSDPSRMAQNFAGVSGASDDRNDIIIRGNSPTGVLWRLEGIDIPSPNHFGTLGTTGGPVTMLNTNNLKNSDFLTGAFPAEYGNATAGVFDLRLRNGNNEKYEFLGQIGFNGFELGAEGPFSKKSKASFIFNYRYSTLGLLSAVGIDFGTGAAIPQYQDITFKINAPTKKLGQFTIFGVGGISYIEFLDSESGEEDFYSNQGEDSRAGSDMGVLGLTHNYFYKNEASGRVILAVSGWNTAFNADSLSIIDGSPTRTDELEFTQLKYTAGYQYNQKLNAKNLIKAGVQFDVFDLRLTNEQLVAENTYFLVQDYNGIAPLLQSFVQWQHRFTDKVTLNSGIHHQHFFLNNTWIVEPRINLRYQFKERQSVSIGAGLHSQMQPLQSYFVETNYTDGSTALTNEDLDFVRSNQLVLGYDNLIGKNFRFKAEVYGQYLTNAGIERMPSTVSLLNEGAGFGIEPFDSLVNNGRGYNYGLELTLEKFFGQGYYFLTTASIFNSQYEGSDEVWRSTKFNSNYVFNILGGKEFKIKSRHTIGFDTKIAVAGGQRYTPIDLDASRLAGGAVYDFSRTFEERHSTYFRWDFKLTYTFQGKRATQKFSVDLQNLTGRQNVFSEEYNTRTGDLETIYQIGFFPDVQYRILF